jgi:hypothetical protein
MKVSNFIYGFAVLCVFSNCIYSQTDTPANHKAGLSEFIFGFGGGFESGLFFENTQYKSVLGIDFYFNLAIRQ